MLRERLGRRGARVVGIGVLLALLILALTLALNLGGVRRLLVSSPVAQRYTLPQEKIWSASHVDGLPSSLCRNSSGAVDLGSADAEMEGITWLKLHAYRGSGRCKNAMWLDVTNSFVGELQVHLHFQREDGSNSIVSYNSNYDKDPDVPAELTRSLASGKGVWKVGPMLGYDSTLKIPNHEVWIEIGDLHKPDGILISCGLSPSHVECGS